MEYHITNYQGSSMIGMKLRMSIAKNRIAQLWQTFMPRQAEVPHRKGREFFAIEVYDADHFQSMFNPNREFDRWAAVPVESTAEVPEGMEQLEIPQGLYVVFQYKGRSTEAGKAYQWIFGQWLPSSGYLIDHRPHFAIMGDKYKNNDPDSEEELWIPIQEKQN